MKPRIWNQSASTWLGIILTAVTFAGCVHVEALHPGELPPLLEGVNKGGEMGAMS